MIYPIPMQSFLRDHKPTPERELDWQGGPMPETAACSNRATYSRVSTPRTLTWILEEDEAASLLRLTLEEEKKTDEKLTQLAGSINLEAAESVESEEGSNRSRKAKTARA